MNFFTSLYLETKPIIHFTLAQQSLAYKGSCLPKESLKSLKVLGEVHSKVAMGLIKDQLLPKVLNFDVWRNVDQFEIISPL
jgi:hypothetical protein